MLQKGANFFWVIKMIRPGHSAWDGLIQNYGKFEGYISIFSGARPVSLY